MLCYISLCFFSFLEKLEVIVGAVTPKGHIPVSVMVTYVIGTASSGLPKSPRAPCGGRRGLIAKHRCLSRFLEYKHSKSEMDIQTDSCLYKPKGVSH